MGGHVRLGDLQLFVRAADLGNLSAASRLLDVSPAVASAALKRLETHVGVRLLARSTRNLRLTAEGERFLVHARQALASLEDGRRALAIGQQAIDATLQLSAPSDFGRNVLLPWLDQLQAQHPRLNVRLLLGDRNADLYRQAADVALRYGQPADASLVALPVCSDNRRVLCASPGYLAARGVPGEPGQLAGHNCLLYQLGNRTHDHWRFVEDGQARVVEVAGDRFSDDADVVRRWAIAGHGIACKSWLDVAADVAAGRLQLVMPQVLGEPAPLNLLCTHRDQLGRPVQVLLQLLRERCQELLTQLPGLLR
ncbi:LysR family transcriptional regulator [Pseudomonas sp. Marseille-QA0332]